ncbi:MAG: heme NO-binding domain-containing protein [Acidimicrobiales bacterium]|nr:heme NO-binding domain-containing protein [Acidimicrobiales bacterium]
MKGIIFNAVEEAVVDLHGPDVWDELLDRAGVDGAYTALGTYPDEDLFGLVGAASALTGDTAANVQRVLGRHCLPVMVRQVEELVQPDMDVFDFLASVHDIIHVEVRKLSPDANPPSIASERIDEETLQLRYRSDRGLPALAEGLILGSGDHFGQPVEIEIRNDLADDGETVFRVRKVTG